MRYDACVAPEHLFAALVLLSLVGVTLSTFGSGGSILAVPVLVYVAGLPTTSAVGTALVIVGATAAVGSIVQARIHGIDGQAAAVFAVTGALGAYVGSHLTHLVAPDTLMLVFGSVMLAAGLRMAVPGRPASSAPRRNVVRSTGIGLAIGVLTGFLGVGGGFMIMPALVLLLGVDPKRAVPTALAVITFNALGGLTGQLQHVRLDWALTGACVLSALAGIAVGVVLVRRLSAARLRRAFGVAVATLGSGIAAAHVVKIAGIWR